MYRPGQDNWEFWLWKFSNFPAILILREISFDWFQKVKNCHLNNFGGEALNFDFWKNSSLKMSKIPKNSEFRAAQMVKKAVSWGFKMTKIDLT